MTGNQSQIKEYSIAKSIFSMISRNQENFVHFNLKLKEIYFNRKIISNLNKFRRNNTICSFYRSDIYNYFYILKVFTLVNFNIIVLYLIRKHTLKSKFLLVLSFNSLYKSIDLINEANVMDSYLKEDITPISYYIRYKKQSFLINCSYYDRKRKELSDIFKSNCNKENSFEHIIKNDDDSKVECLVNNKREILRNQNNNLNAFLLLNSTDNI